MMVHGWNNGSPNNKTGGGYGIRVSKDDRDKYFRDSWKTITIEFDDSDLVEVRVSKSFWEGCIELRHSKIGKWMVENKLAPWGKGTPPIFILESICNRKFRLKRG